MAGAEEAEVRDAAHRSRRQRPGSASERSARRFRKPLAWGLTLSLGLHVSGFPLLSRLSIPGLPRTASRQWSVATVIDYPPVVEVPSPPESVERPDLPLPPPVGLDDGIRIGASVKGLPAGVEVGPPPGVRPSAGPMDFVSYDVPPLLGNRDQFGRMVWYLYPLELQRAGIEGEVELAIFIDEAGIVGEVRLEKSSGWPRMDDAALRLAERMEFLPALMRDRLVGVWVHQRVCFVLPHRDAAMTPAAAAIAGTKVEGCASHGGG